MKWAIVGVIGAGLVAPAFGQSLSSSGAFEPALGRVQVEVDPPGSAWDGCGCVCDYDMSTGPGVCDIFDFLAFGNLFANGNPCACDLDQSTGPGVCDIFDFLAFGNLFPQGCGPQVLNVTFSQVNVDFDDVAMPFSPWGSVDITYVGGNQYLFVSLWVNGQPAIQNAPLLSTAGPGIEQTSTINFPISDRPGPISGFRANFGVTLQPIIGPPPSIGVAQVQQRDVIMRGGAIDFQMELTEPLPVQAPPPLTAAFARASLLPNQEVQRNGCAPGAISNSLKYLKARHRLDIPDERISVQALKEPLEWGPRGCPYPDWIDNKAAYAAQWGITTRTTTDPAEALAALERGCDVELCNIRHVAAISGIVRLGMGKWAIWVVHDTKQGADGGLKEELVILDKNDLSLWDGWGFDGTRLSEFIIECPP